MIIKTDYLVKINNKNRIQRVLLNLEKDDGSNLYTLNRITGQYGGKETNQPVISITSGKAKRTTAEQAMLIYNSHVKKYLDSGYMLLGKLTSKQFSDLTEDEIKDLLGGEVTDQSGIPKPMLAKLADQCSPDIFESKWYVSRKLDGTRCLMYWKNNEIHTASRGGGEYDASTTHIRTNPVLIEFFKQHPDIILDGEIYKHDALYPLQRISGLVRLKEWDEKCSVLEYWIYDYISKEPFKDRWGHLKEWRDVFKNEKCIKILDQKEMSGYLTIKREHDKYVQEGFEGLCMRNPNKEYGVNKRSGVYLVKMKERLDDEAEIVGVREGLRPEDMCFILKWNDKEFAAKPIGDVNTRLEYLKNKDSYIGKMGTFTYFSVSTDGCPTQPVFKAVRYKDDLS